MADAADIRRAVTYLYRLKNRSVPDAVAMDGYVLALEDLEWPWIQEACRRAVKTRTVPPDGSQLRTLAEIVRFEVARQEPPKVVHEPCCSFCDDSGWRYVHPNGRLAENVTVAVTEMLRKVTRCGCWDHNPTLTHRRRQQDAIRHESRARESHRGGDA